MDNNEVITLAADDNLLQTRAALLNKKINSNAKVLAESLGEIGRDLKVMRDERLYTELGFGTFEDYCNMKTPIGQRQAYNFIRCYEKYGERLAELAGIGITKLVLMTALDDEDCDELIESGDAENLSARELAKRVKELQNKNEQLTLEMEELKNTSVSNETDTGVFNEMRGKMVAAEQDNERLKSKIEELEGLADANNAVAETLRQEKEDLESELDELEKKLKDLESKPVEVAVQKPSADEIAKIEKAAAKKAEKATKKQHEEELKKLRDELDEARIVAVNAARKESLAEIERLKAEKADLQSSAKKPPLDDRKAQVKFFLGECLKDFNSALESCGEIEDKAARKKCLETMNNIVNKMTETLVDTAAEVGE